MSLQHRYRFTKGDFSCEIEGSPEFIEEKLESLLERSLTTLKSAGIATHATSANQAGEGVQLAKEFDESLSTNTIALTTNVKTGSDLVIAAIAYLQIVKGQSKVTRSELAEELKTATTFYKATYTSNLSAYLDTLTKSRRLNLISKDTYSLTSSEVESLKSVLSSA